MNPVHEPSLERSQRLKNYDLTHRLNSKFGQLFWHIIPNACYSLGINVETLITENNENQSDKLNLPSLIFLKIKQNATWLNGLP